MEKNFPLHNPFKNSLKTKNINIYVFSVDRGSTDFRFPHAVLLTEDLRDLREGIQTYSLVVEKDDYSLLVKTMMFF